MEEEKKEGTSSTTETVTPTVSEQNLTTPPAEAGTGTQESNAASESKEGQQGSQDPNKPEEGQSKEDNAKFAKMRHENDVKKAKAAGDAEGYKRARIKSVGGKNPYANDAPIETDEDFEFYELQDEIKANGGDPSNPWEVEQLRRQKAKEAADAAEANKTEEEKRQERLTNELKACNDAGIDNKTIKSYLDNKEFYEFYEPLAEKGVDLLTCINSFNKFKPAEPNKTGAANNQSSPGSSENHEGATPTKSFSEMSEEEFKKYMEGVKSGKIKIS